MYSVGLDEQGLPTTAFLETIPAAGAGGAPAATITDIGDASAVPPAALPDPTSNPVVTRDDVLSSPTGTVTSRPGESAPFYLLYTSSCHMTGVLKSANEIEYICVCPKTVTYVVYLTVDGVQVTSIATFTPKTPTPSTTIPPQSGTIVDIATYLPPPPPSSTSESLAALPLAMMVGSDEEGTNTYARVSAAQLQALLLLAIGPRSIHA